MTPAELRAAAERLTTPRAMAGVFNGGDAERVELGQQVALAYLAAVRADDDEVATPGWAHAALGWEWWTTDVDAYVRVDSFFVHLTERANGRVGLRLAVDVFELDLGTTSPTRGQVRAACRVFGVPLPEGG